MNNFDRPAGITVDNPNVSTSGESVASEKPTSEVTYYTALKDLNRNQFYIRQITMLNFVKFDMAKLSDIKTVKVVSFDDLTKQTSQNGEELFFN
jgi:penicillin V acylase-like amidase (Ntn superfamily)